MVRSAALPPVIQYLKLAGISVSCPAQGMPKCILDFSIHIIISFCLLIILFKLI